MKKITIALLMLASFSASAQQKSTGNITIFTGLSANLVLDNSNTTATLTINGPADRWFAIAFGFTGSAMGSGTDVVYYNGTTLVDASQTGIGGTPAVDAVNNWTITSNTVASGTRTIIATRPFVADGTDYTFNFANNDISIAGARASSVTYNVLGHGGNRANSGNVALASLGIEDFSLNATQVYPNPSNGNFNVKTKTGLEKITVYSQTGALVKTIEVNSQEEVEVSVNGLSTGVYLMELQNGAEKSWKKIIVN
ncbi:MAG TPA: T9SS type A sorting domain-containing protein [Flavobacterium sp.]|nr:T9SS type A sorting domain-containing protein [Flavobacterium sp.]